MKSKEHYLEKLATLLESKGIRKHTCINGIGHSQIERDIVDLFIETAEVKHTPLQWEQKGNSGIHTSKGDCIALTYGENRKENAELICKAVNSHHLLIEALQKACDKLEQARGFLKKYSEGNWGMCETSHHRELLQSLKD